MNFLGIFRRPQPKAPEQQQVRVIKQRVPTNPRAQRNWEAAAVGERLTWSWTANTQTIDRLLMNHLKVLVARSRDQALRNDYGRRFRTMVVSNIVGPAGIRLQAKSRDQDGSYDEKANQAIEDAWRDWGRCEFCDWRRRLSWIDLQKLAIRTVAVDGELLIRLIRGDGPYGLSLELLDPTLLPVTLNEDKLSGGSYIRLGIEFDVYNRPVAYYLPSGPDIADQVQHFTSGSYLRVPAREILHVFVPEIVNQKRGIPWMATALLRMQMVGAYEVASLTAAETGASKMGFITRPAAEGYEGDAKDAAGNALMDMEPGSIEELPEGSQFLGWDPRYPSGEFAPFMKAILRGIASGLGVSYNALANDLEGVNYSSIRQGVLEEREQWKDLQQWFIDAFCQPIYETWLGTSLALGAISVHGGALRPDRELKYRSVVWQPRRWAWVDPSSDMAANKGAVDLRVRSRGAIIREEGLDPQDVWDELAEEEKELGSRGLIPSPAGPAPKPEDKEAGNATTAA